MSRWLASRVLGVSKDSSMKEIRKAYDDAFMKNLNGGSKLVTIKTVWLSLSD